MGTSSERQLPSREPWTSPLFRWAGSKRKLLPRLLSAVPKQYDRYYEPFVGSACLFFALHPKRAVLGDINADLIDTYDTICKHPLLVARKVLGLHTDSSTYYRVRATSPSTLEPIDRAARFTYLNRLCFNGVYRVNRSGHFNVPKGTRTGRLPTDSTYRRCAFALRSAELRKADYVDCVADVGPGDFVYLDPPYASARRNRFGEYGYGCFEADRDLPTLIRMLTHIDTMGAHFLLSFCSHPMIRALPDSWVRSSVRVRRHIAGFASNRHRVTEVFVSNIRFPR